MEKTEILPFPTLVVEEGTLKVLGVPVPKEVFFHGRFRKVLDYEIQDKVIIYVLDGD